MKPLETKAEFIRLRAEGFSFDKIAEKLHIAKATCSGWEQELKASIASLKQDSLNELYQAYHMTKEARIRKLGGVLERIDDALDKVDLTELPPEKLLDFTLKYTEALKAEYIGDCMPLKLTDTSPQSITGALENLLNRIRAGEVTPEQAGRESIVLANILKAYEITDAKSKLDMLESIIEERGGLIQ